MCCFKLPTRESVWFSYYLILNSTWCQSLVCACVWVTRRSVGMAPRWPNCAGNMWTEALLFPPITTHLSLSYFPTLNSLFPWGEWEMASQSPSFFPLFLFASPLPSSPLAWLSSKARSFFSCFCSPFDLFTDLLSREDISKQTNGCYDAVIWIMQSKDYQQTEWHWSCFNEWNSIF